MQSSTFMQGLRYLNFSSLYNGVNLKKSSIVHTSYFIIQLLSANKENISAAFSAYMFESSTKAAFNALFKDQVNETVSLYGHKNVSDVTQYIYHFFLFYTSTLLYFRDIYSTF